MCDLARVEAALSAHAEVALDGCVERASMLPSPGGRLFAVTLAPADCARTTALVVCPSYFELKFFQRVEIGLLRSAAATGRAGVYVQPQGFGDSEGDAATCTVARRVDAALIAADAALALPGVESVCFVGARLGAPVALLAAGRMGSASVALWDPALDGDDYWKQTRRFARVMNALGMGAVEDPDRSLERDGEVLAVNHLLTSALRDDLRSIAAVRTLPPMQHPSLVVGLNDALLHGATSALRGVLPQLEDVSLGLPKLRHAIHLRIGEAEDAVDATLEWAGRRLP